MWRRPPAGGQRSCYATVDDLKQWRDFERECDESSCQTDVCKQTSVRDNVGRTDYCHVQARICDWVRGHRSPRGGGRASEAAKCCLEPSYFSDDEASMPFTLYVRTVIDTYIRDRKCNVILRTWRTWIRGLAWVSVSTLCYVMSYLRMLKARRLV